MAGVLQDGGTGSETEVCQCAEVRGLVLACLCSPNPLHCVACRGEIGGEALGLAGREIEELRRCFAVNGALFELWLESGEYADFAKTSLLNPEGQVNRDGMEMARRLSTRWPTYYWWFQDAEDGEAEKCPSCGEELDRSVEWGSGKCERCRVMV